MKVNYHNEDYRSNIAVIVICVILMIFVIVWGIYHLISIHHIDVGLAIFGSICIIFLAVPLLVLIKDYRKKKQQRILNLFIIKNGKRIKGKIVSIYDNFTFRISGRGIHNVIAEIAYSIDGEDKMIVVEDLYIDIYRYLQFRKVCK